MKWIYEISTISDHFTIYIPCAILELSGRIPEFADKVEIPTLFRIIPESFCMCLLHLNPSFVVPCLSPEPSSIPSEIFDLEA